MILYILGFGTIALLGIVFLIRKKSTQLTTESALEKIKRGFDSCCRKISGGYGI